MEQNRSAEARQNVPARHSAELRQNAPARKKVARQKRRINPVLWIIIAALLLVLVTVVIAIGLGYRYVSCEGIKFLGRTKNGVPWDGRMKYPSGETAELDRKNRTIKFSDKSEYVGDIDVLCRDGNGEMTMAGGGRYVGEWKDDRMEGHGTYYYEGGEGNGDFYDGEFRDGKFHGQGTFSWSNGDIYEGSYANGLMDGYGKFVWANGDTYTGSYSKGARNGRGRFETTGEAGCYDGDWVDDKKQGQGVLDYKNGDRYSGSFVNGLPDTRVLDENGAFVVMESGEYKHGAEGIYTWKDGRQYTGYFKEGKIVVQDPDKQGKE